MKVKNQSARKPLSAEDAADELLKNWPIPDVSPDERKYQGRSTVFGTPLSEFYQKTQAPEPEEEAPPEPMTIEQLEQLRQDAFDEGLKQGHEQGYQEGFELGKKEGHDAGVEEGKTEGIEQGLAEAKPLVDEKLTALNDILEGMSQPLGELGDAAEQALVDLAVHLAEAVILTEVKTNPKAILAALSQCVNALPERHPECDIQLHPDDIDTILGFYGDDGVEDKKWRLQPDANMARGGCIVSTETASIDFSIEKRIKDTLDSFLQDAGIQRQKSE